MMAQVAPVRVAVAGASGLVGSLLLQHAAVGEGAWSALSRRPLPGLPAPIRACSWEDPPLAGMHGFPDRLDVLVSCLGTTLRKAGSRAAFEAVDYALVLRLAQQARAAGARQLVLVSSVDANPGAGNFYLQVKGRLEQAVVALGFERVDLLRPSLLLGERRERRIAEQLGQRLTGMITPLLQGRWRRYRPIAAGHVAAATLALVGRPGSGVHVHHYDAMLSLAGEA